MRKSPRIQQELLNWKLRISELASLLFRAKIPKISKERIKREKKEYEEEKKRIRRTLNVVYFRSKGAYIYRGGKVRGLGCEGVVGERSPPSTPITTPNVHKFVPNVHKPPRWMLLDVAAAGKISISLGLRVHKIVFWFLKQIGDTLFSQQHLRWPASHHQKKKTFGAL